MQAQNLQGKSVLMLLGPQALLRMNSCFGFQSLMKLVEYIVV
jgi:hypothetical protein